MTDTPTPAGVPDAPDMPIFGRNPTPAETRQTREFGLEVEVQHPATRGVPPRIERMVESFTTYVDLDAGAVLGLMNARNSNEQANRTAVLLGTTLDDLDGVPVAWVPPAEPEYDDEGNALRGDPSDAHPEGEPLYLFWNGDLVTADELTIDELTEGSSRRRFAVLMDDTARRVRIEALNEIASWLTEKVAGRPTVRPTHSQRGPQRTRAGRVAR